MSSNIEPCKPKRGLFIVIEGIDGSGKSTLVKTISEILYSFDKNQQVFLTREPTWRASFIRSQFGNQDKTPSYFAKVFVEDRKLHLQEDIIPILERGIHVVCDRYKYSTYAYQTAQGMELDEVIKLHSNEDNKGSWAVEPDLIFLTQCDPSVAVTRIEGVKDKFDSNLEFQKKVAVNYDSMIDPKDRYDVNTQNQSIEENKAFIKDILRVELSNYLK